MKKYLSTALFTLGLAITFAMPSISRANVDDYTYWDYYDMGYDNDFGDDWFYDYYDYGYDTYDGYYDSYYDYDYDADLFDWEEDGLFE